MVERAFKGESYDDQLERRFTTVLRSAREAVAAICSYPGHPVEPWRLYA